MVPEVTEGFQCTLLCLPLISRLTPLSKRKGEREPKVEDNEEEVKEVK